MLKRAILTVYPTLYVTFYYPSMPNSLYAKACERRSAGQNFCNASGVTERSPGFWSIAREIRATRKRRNNGYL